MFMLFVYGTLKEGYGNHRLLEEQTLLMRAVELKGYEMRSFGYFPVISPNDDASVVGELYVVTEEALARCDMLEGHPSFYQRVCITDKVQQVLAEEGIKATMPSYTYIQSEEAVASLQLVEGGVW